VLPLQQNAKPFNTRKDNMTTQSHTGKILQFIHHEDMKDCKQISPDVPSVTEQSCSYRNHRKLKIKIVDYAYDVNQSGVSVNNIQ
jgi:hypothetical protein